MYKISKELAWVIIKDFPETNRERFMLHNGFTFDDFHYVKRKVMSGKDILKQMQDLKRFNICIYMLNFGDTLRDAQLKYGESKSCLHKWIHTDLPTLSPELYAVMKRFMEEHKYSGRSKGGKVCQFRRAAEKEANK